MITGTSVSPIVSVDGGSGSKVCPFCQSATTLTRQAHRLHVLPGCKHYVLGSTRKVEPDTYTLTFART